MSWNRLGLDLLVRISMFMDPISLIHLREASKYVNTIAQTDTFNWNEFTPIP